LLETLERMNTPGRLRQFPLGVGETRAALKGRETLGRLNGLRELLQSIQPHLTYLTRAELRLPAEHPWQAEVNQARQQHLTWLRDPALRADPALYSRLNGSLSNLRAAYAQAYLALHNQARLDRAGDERKRVLTQDPRWRHLFGLQDVRILPGKAFEKLKEEFNALRACSTLTPADLSDHTECPHCGFDPRLEAPKQPAIAALETLEADLAALHADWLTRLRAELSKPEAAQTIPLLKPPYREQIETFAREGRLPDSISKGLSEAINDALSGLEKVTIDGTVFLSTLTKGGMPCSVEELYQRFDALIESHLSGKKRDKVRIEIDW
jgi:rubredoxin